MSDLRPSDGSLLLELPVPFRMYEGELFVEAQAEHGLERWLENFPRITVCAPVLPASLGDGGMIWMPAAKLLNSGRATLVPLTWAYGVKPYFAHAGATRRLLRALIRQHQYLCFSNLGWLGAWGRVASEEAFKQGRPYSVWLDWVLHEMPVDTNAKGLKRLWRKFQRRMLKSTSLRDIRRSSLGLFHGKSVFDGYAGWSSNPHLVHDVHLSEEDLIDASALNDRLRRQPDRYTILYIGRVHPMKGPMQWIETLQHVFELSPGLRQRIQARWIGDGPLLEASRQRVNALNLQDVVQFSGAQFLRKELLADLRSADLFLFCHLTPESPRCLIEALMSGVPIAGFESAYACDLLAGVEGGIFVDHQDPIALASAIQSVLLDPDRLARLSRGAFHAGRAFSATAVFRHRSDLIKRYLRAS